ncbi:uncharacterized protein LOC101861750 [Aplysia californica]|uniref:Uncharacterized protein LOC101861750 n=1 Tax=Aplysia californica TaxID=6500 RepID=A0ABM0JXA1_APLCA|nr:uncharacterized protein LOC101861750 [Aplysia californica]
MTPHGSVGLLLLLSVVSMATSQAVDFTRLPEATGESVVRATVSQIRESCAFQNDYLYLKRLAFVSSEYGEASGSFRPGFHGGIWQISREDYKLTLYMDSTFYDLIRKKLNIEWRKTKWSDLRKPIYSGIAAMLTLERLSPIPRNAKGQAKFFQKNLSGNATLFLDLISQTQRSCDTEELDMAFVLDGSASMTSSEFKESKKFTSLVLRNFYVEPDFVRVSVSTFSDTVTEYIRFLQFITTRSVRKAVFSIRRENGHTNTALALNYLRRFTFTTQGKSRKEAAKIAIIQTDGNSNSRIKTIEAASRLRAAGVTVFAIGIGDGIDSVELEGIASHPTCTHVRKIAVFSELKSLVDDVKDAVCKTNIFQNFNTENKYKCTREKTVMFDVISETTIVARPELGNLNIFGSFKITEPNSAFGDFSSIARAEKPLVIYLDKSDQTLYLSFSANVTHEDHCSSTFIVKAVDSNAMRKTAASTVCITDGHTRKCTDIDYVKSGDYQKVIAPSSSSATRACVEGLVGYQPHPNTTTKYVYCVSKTEAYVVTCPNGFAYLSSQQDCVVPASMDNDTVCRVCSSENWLLGLRNFPVAAKSRLYVNCTAVETCVIKDCGDNLQYYPNDQKCAEASLGSSTWSLHRSQAYIVVVLVLLFLRKLIC